MNQLERFTTAAIIALLVLPGSAVASLILNLNTLGAIDSEFSSGTTFADPASLGWDLTINSSNGKDISVVAVGLGVTGGSSGGLGYDEGLIFNFNPLAYLEGFTINQGNNEILLYSVAPSGPGGISSMLGAGAGGVYDFNVIATATSLSIYNIFDDGNNPSNSNFRVGSLWFADPVACDVDCAPKPVPEPSVIALFAAGILGLGIARRRMRN